jgi:hypothetical protein
MGDILFEPPVLSLFGSENGSMPLSVLIQSERPFKIIKLEDKTGYLNLSVSQSGEDFKDRRYIVTATLKGGYTNSSILGVIQIHTDLESQPLIRIPVIGTPNNSYQSAPPQMPPQASSMFGPMSK